MTIMIDLDDTICHYNFLDYLNEFAGTNYQKKDIKTYYMEEILPSEQREKFKEFIVKKNLYANAKIYDNAIEVIKRLNQNNDIFICSAYVFKDNPQKSGNHILNKFNFLCKIFPFINPNNFIFIYDKELLNIDIKIDDKIDNLKNAKIKILYDAYHNQNFSVEELKEKGIIRAHNWLEIETIINNIAN